MTWNLSLIFLIYQNSIISNREKNFKYELSVIIFQLDPSPQDPNLFWDLPKNEISRRSFMKIFTRSHSSENLLKIFRRKDFMKILIRTFSSKNLQKIYINFLQKILKEFLPKIFLRSLKDLQFKSFGDLWKIFSSNLWEIFGRSSFNIFLRSTKELIVFFFIFSFEKNSGKSSK